MGYSNSASSRIAKIAALSVLGAAAMVLVLLTLVTLTSFFPVDDAYISFRYARHWAEGQGPVFNPGERVEGYSSFLWVALLTLGCRIGLTPPLAARILSLAAVFALTPILAALAGRAHGTVRWYVWVMPGVLVPLLRSTPFHILSGLETTLAAALLALAVWVHGSRWWAFSSVIFLALSLTRPEGIVIFIGVLAAEFALRRSRRLLDREMLFWVAAFAVPYALYVAWRVLYYGYPLPNTVYAKMGLGLRASLTGSLAYFQSFVAWSWPMIVLSGAAVLLVRNRHVSTAAAAVVSAACFYLVGGVGDNYPYHRYLYPIAILIAYLAVVGGVALYRRSSARDRRFAYAAALAITLVATVQGILLFGALRTSIRPERLSTNELVGKAQAFLSQDQAPHLDGNLRDGLGLHWLADWLVQHASPGDLLATSEIGIAPYYSRLKVLDMFGLADEYIARLPGPPGTRMDTEYVFAQRPDFISIRVPSGRMWGGTAGEDMILADLQLRLSYDFVRSFPYEATTILLFARRGTPPPFVVYYDFVENFTYDRVSLVALHGQQKPPPELARSIIGNRDVAFLATKEQESEITSLLRTTAEESTPDYFASDLMREWLGMWRPFLYHHPLTNETRPSIDYEMQIPPGAILHFGIGMARECWDPGYGDGVLYEILLADDGGGETPIFSHYIDPKNNPSDRGWLDFSIDLSPWQGERVTLCLVTSPGPMGNSDHDYGGWGQPQVWIAG